MALPAPVAMLRRGTRSVAKPEDAAQPTTNLISGSSPLSSLHSTPKNSPAKKVESGESSPKTISAEGNSTFSPRKVMLRLNFGKRPLPDAQSIENQGIYQPSLKRKRTSASQVDESLESSVLKENAPVIERLTPSSTSETQAMKTTSSRKGTKNITSLALPHKAEPTKKTVKPPEKKFAEDSIVAYALREIYNATPRLPEHKLKLRSVPLGTRRKVMELVERFSDFEATQGNSCLDTVHAIKLDLNFWDDDVPNVCRVQYPFFEAVMEKILFWIERGREYKAEQSSLANYEEAKAVGSLQAGNSLVEEDKMGEIEINSILSELQAVEKEPLTEGLQYKDPTRHRLRASILNVANRFCTEQSRVGLDCTKLIDHLRADLHLCPGDFRLMREEKLTIPSKPEIDIIMRKLRDWFGGNTIYAAGRRAVEVFADTWYEDYSALHHKMSSLGLFTQ